MATYHVATTGNDSTGDGSIGNPYATPGKAASVATTTLDKINLKTGTYTITTSTPGAGGPVVLSSGKEITIEGYAVTPGDRGTPPVISAGSVGSISIISATGSFNTTAQRIINVTVDGNSQSGVVGFSLTGGSYPHAEVAYLCNAQNCVTGFNCDVSALSNSCKATSCTTAGFSGPATYHGCEAVSCGTYGFNVMSGVCVKCIARGGTGIGFDWSGTTIIGGPMYCTARGNSGDGFKSTTYDIGFWIGCVSVLNGGYGFNLIADPQLFDCYTYSNTSGSCSVTPNFTGITALSGDPFTSSSDMRPKTSGAGLEIQGKVIGAPAQTNNNDAGAVQHADAAGGSAGMLFIPDLSGT